MTVFNHALPNKTKSQSAQIQPPETDTALKIGEGVEVLSVADPRTLRIFAVDEES